MTGTVIALILLGPDRPPAPATGDKVLVSRFEKEVCAAQGDHGIRSEHAAIVEGTGEPGRIALLYMAGSKEGVTAWNRACAIDLLGELHDRRVVPILRRILEEPTVAQELWAKAIYHLTLFKETDALPAIIAVVNRHNRGEVAYSRALHALGEFDDERARAALRAALVDPNLPEEDRGDVASLIGQQRDRQAIPLLAAMAAQPGDDLRRMRAIFALARIGSREGLAAAREGFLRLSNYRDSAARELLATVEKQRAGADDGELAEIDRLTDLARRALAENPAP